MILHIILGAAVLALFIWLMIPNQKSPTQPDAPFIDPDDSYQIGLLTGLTGGSIPDAAVMRYALQHFQKIHGRRATSTDIGIVLGIIESQRPQ